MTVPIFFWSDHHLTTLSQINLTNGQYIVAYSNMGEGCKQAGDGVNRWLKGEHVGEGVSRSVKVTGVGVKDI